MTYVTIFMADGNAYRLRDPEIVRSAMWGNCLHAEYERYPDVWILGSFRCDLILETQLELENG